MPKSFARIRLNMLLKSQAFGAVGALVWSVADMIVSDNMVGVDALAGLMSSYEDRRYLNTIGCNRAAFVFPK